MKSYCGSTQNSKMQLLPCLLKRNFPPWGLARHLLLRKSWEIESRAMGIRMGLASRGYVSPEGSGKKVIWSVIQVYGTF